MESIGLDMEDLFHTEADLDDDIAIAPMPDLEEDDDAPVNPELEAEEAPGGADPDVLSKLKDISKGAAKKRVLRPQPKLDVQRLRSDRGLPALPKLFKDVKFKGKGHEAEDLESLMKKLEHWSHRLFPKLPFDDFIERMEKLGHKKPVQTCVKRIRLGLDDDDDDDDVTRGIDEETGAEGKESGRGAEGGGDDTGFTDKDAEEAYEEMIRQERALAEKRRLAEGGDGRLADGDDGTGSSPAQRTRDKEGCNEEVTSETPTAKAQHDLSAAITGSQPEKKGGLTAEQLARIEKNRQMALERRLAKLGKSPKGTPSPAKPSTQSKVSRASEPSAEPSQNPSSPCKTRDISNEDCKKAPVCRSGGGDQGTVEELEAMLDEEEDKDNVDTGCSESPSAGSFNKQQTSSRNSQSEEQSVALNLHLTESEDAGASGGTLEENAQNDATLNNNTCSSKSPFADSMPNNDTEHESHDLSECHTEDLVLRLPDSVSEGVNSSEMDQNGSQKEDHSNTEQVFQNPAGSKDSGDGSMKETCVDVETASGDAHLQLKLSVSDDEGGMESD